MKRLLMGLVGLLMLVSPLWAAEGGEKTLLIYTYDSFASEWGLAPKVIPVFEKKTGIKVKLVSFGGSGQVLQKAMLEKDAPKADVLIGIDNNLLGKAKASGVLTPYRSPLVQKISKGLHFDPEYYVTPFDYGYLSIIYDSEVLENPPTSLEELAQKKYEKSLILMDARTSGPGLGFLYWTIAVYKENYLDFWKRLSPSILTIADGWSSGYGLFTNGEAPMVLSYSSSPVYHVAYEKSTRYKATAFKEGLYMQIEGAGIVKGAPHRKEAEAFIDFMLSEDFQKEIALTNIMFPANDEVTLPESFSHAIKPSKELQLEPADIESKGKGWISSWVDAVSR